MHSSQTNKRILYADILRVLAVFAVMTNHVCASGLFVTPISSFNWQVINFYDCLTRWAVPIFVMISGMFLLNPEKEMSLTKIYREKILRIATALIFWGFIYRSIYAIKLSFIDKTGFEISFQSMLNEYVLIFCGSAWYHLWFLYMIIGLYVLAPLFRIFTQNAKKKDYLYLFILFFTFGSILPLIKDSLSLINSSIRINFGIIELLGYSTFFILGYYLSKFEVSEKIKHIIFGAAFVSVILQIIGTFFVSNKTGIANEFLYGNTRPNVVIQAIAVFLFIKDYPQKIAITEKMQKSFLTLSKYSFGMYLVHDLFNGFCSIIGFTTTSFSPILAIPARSLATLLMSFIVVWVLNKIPILNKYCI